ncbi:hypothetical protein SOVF_018750 [Spinacia oleracea]|uniref:Protein S40-5-like n=1 Tax=Spinacia oleracea TaxID=3562 RepID=A0ABM3R074_SPIOL|nr:protein S40-5-like [Spinacia oleracea]KNA24128.1 hypothetical protein SOVF_018750 [Spinacia oleracea]
MAKGRRLSSSRSDRLLGTGTTYNYYDHGHNHDHDYLGNDNVSEVTEFVEEDVWSMVDDTSENNHHQYHHHFDHIREWVPRATVESGRRGRGVSVTSREEERHHHVGGLSLAFEEDKAPPSSTRRILHQYGDATRRGRGGGGPLQDRNVASSAPVDVPDWSKILRVNSVESSVNSDEDYDPVVDSAVEPPHEYLARSRKMNAFSVFEGVGRTLKGRDMTRVRDAIWSQTGFEG